MAVQVAFCFFGVYRKSVNELQFILFDQHVEFFPCNADREDYLHHRCLEHRRNYKRLYDYPVFECEAVDLKEGLGNHRRYWERDFELEVVLLHHTHDFARLHDKSFLQHQSEVLPVAVDLLWRDYQSVFQQQTAALHICGGERRIDRNRGKVLNCIHFVGALHSLGEYNCS